MKMHLYPATFSSVTPLLQPDHFKFHGYGPDTRWMQDVVGWVWASCMHFSHQRQNKVSKVAECYNILKQH